MSHPPTILAAGIAVVRMKMGQRMDQDNSIAVATEPPTAPQQQTPQVQPKFYEFDSTRVTLREYAWAAPTKKTLFLLGLFKLLGIQVSTGSDDPNVEALAPFLADKSVLPDEIRQRFEPMLLELAELGFADAVYHHIPDPLHAIHLYIATLTHPSGRAIARVHCRVWGIARPPKVVLYCEFLSAFEDGTFLWSLAVKPDWLAPANMRIVRKIDAAPRELFAAHEQQLAIDDKSRALTLIQSTEQMLEISERHHADVRDFHIKRGVFRPLTTFDEQRMALLREHSEGVAPEELQYLAVLNEINRQQRKQTGWLNQIANLAVSIFAFAAFGFFNDTFELMLLLIPVLFFHELGHYVAMRACGYRNVQMFFIPLFGAAVSGQNYSAPGWKKALVALAGPVPGIVLGIFLGMLGALIHRPVLTDSAMLLLVLNGFQLLPVLPLDGGHVVHALVFSRNYLLDAAFRALAVAALLGFGIWKNQWIFTVLGILLLLNLSTAIKLARLASQLRKEELPSDPSSNQTMPPDLSRRIFNRLRAIFPKPTHSKITAIRTLSVYETLCARAPRWAASLAFGATYLASIAATILFARFFIDLKNSPPVQEDPQAQFPPAAQRAMRAMLGAQNALPIHVVLPATVERVQGHAFVSDDTRGRNILVATFDAPEAARREFDQLRSTLPDNGAAQLFGDSLMLVVPASDDAARKKWLARFDARSSSVFVANDAYRATLDFACRAPSESVAQAIVEEIEQYHRASDELHLIPPWYSSDTRTSEQLEQHRKARSTYSKLVTQGFSDRDQKAWAKLNRRRLEAARQGDRAELERIRDEQKNLNDQGRESNYHELRQLGPEVVDLQVIDQYAAIMSKGLKYKEQNDALCREIGPLLGQLPMHDGKVLASTDRETIRAARVLREQTQVRISWVTFVDVFDGAPALVHWLQKQGCTDVRYDFQAPTASWEEQQAEDEPN